MTYANALSDYRAMRPVKSTSRRRCSCGVRATHVGTAAGVAMITACEWHTRMWVRNPTTTTETLTPEEPTT